MKKRSYIMITKRGTGEGRIGQVIDYLSDKSGTKMFCAIRLNYNGQVLFVENHSLRIPSQEEKKKDKKLHNRELQLDKYERSRFNILRYE